MAQPSAMRDRFIMVATNALHQVLIALNRKVKDELLDEPAMPEGRRFFPSRRDKELQLKELAKLWYASKAFITRSGNWMIAATGA